MYPPRYVVLSLATAKLFSAKGKARRPGSIYRPYLGDYVRKDGSTEDPNFRDVLEKVKVGVFQLYIKGDVPEKAHRTFEQLCHTSVQKGGTEKPMLRVTVTFGLVRLLR